jgi:hypothetical protein
MSLSKSNCLYSYNCLHFLKRAVPLNHRLQLYNDSFSCSSVQSNHLYTLYHFLITVKAPILIFFKSCKFVLSKMWLFPWDIKWLVYNWISYIILKNVYWAITALRKKGFPTNLCLGLFHFSITVYLYIEYFENVNP